MSFELAMLAASCVLCLVQIIVSSHAASLQRGYRWTASSRDAEVPPLTGAAGRLERALRNFLETFPVFAAAVIIVHMLDRERRLVWSLKAQRITRQPVDVRDLIL